MNIKKNPSNFLIISAILYILAFIIVGFIVFNLSHSRFETISFLVWLFVFSLIFVFQWFQILSKNFIPIRLQIIIKILGKIITNLPIKIAMLFLTWKMLKEYITGLKTNSISDSIFFGILMGILIIAEIVRRHKDST